MRIFKLSLQFAVLDDNIKGIIYESLVHHLEVMNTSTVWASRSCRAQVFKHSLTENNNT